MICYIENCVRVHYNAEAQLLHYGWCGDTITTDGLRPALEAIAVLAQQLRIRQCLLDISTLPAISIEDQFWLLHTWLPKVCVPTVECVALIVGSRQYNLMVIENILQAGRRFIHFEVQLFFELEAAFDWLVGGREEAAQRLLDEWHRPQSVYDDVEALLVNALPLCR
ncbi:hypothetical protein LRS06_08530 [Hymenobacter sp. J193]|uniref:hypothetical protein n=1 Tax=Hymenobacter sp. J193 TaxID=2898429 RepID=UPI002150C423|nr:hypothetical protein [Hymenobacter sp. J193]MCR5887823.1 hypothetical protein [Hymenobacter sp. J193]